MAFLPLRSVSGLQPVLSAAITSALSAGVAASSTTAGQALQFFNPTSYHTAWARLSYEPREDLVILSDGLIYAPEYQALVTASGVETAGVNRVPWTHTLLAGASLDPANGGLTARGFTAYHFPVSGSSLGFTTDPSTGKLYQQWWHFLMEAPRYAEINNTFAYGGGVIPLLTPHQQSPWIFYTWTTDGKPVQLSAVPCIGSTAQDATAAGYLNFTPGFFRPPVGGLRLQDVVVFAHADLNGQYTWLSCRTIPADDEDSVAWRGTRDMPLGPPMALAVTGVDRFIGVWWATMQPSSPLVYTLFRYDRVQQRLFLDDVGRVPTAFTYTYPWHVGFATFDTKRGALILLSPDATQFDTFRDARLALGGALTTLRPPVPLSPYQAGYRQTFATVIYADATPGQLDAMAVSYDPALTSGVEATALGKTTFANGATGAGVFKLSWTSAGAGTSTLQIVTAQTYSVVVSATVAGLGVAYGADPVTLLASTQTFTVSTAVSAVTPVSLTTAVAITPRQAAATDAVGHGAARLLSYPTSALAGPILYELNPQQWTNMGATPFVRPLYASQKTLSKTATVQFLGDVTDLEVTETWVGGGNRVAMSLSMFTALWDYYTNVPDLTGSGFITWEPRDISPRRYTVLLTGLEVGGTEVVTLDNLYKVTSPWIHETVTLRMRLVEELAADTQEITE